MKENIIGREEEKQLLNSIYHSERSEFVAVCGRRRIGKTFLVREFFENELVFSTSGVARQGMKEQIATFYRELLACGGDPAVKMPGDWMEMFFLFRQFLERQTVKRKVILLDELPWMDTPRSGFLAALEYFWNVWASARRDIVLIVCGSATSWMMDKLINNHGGLHNRLTRQIFLEPFTLGECEQFLQHKGFCFSRYEIAQCYMILGGTPYYLDMLQPHLSLSQNVDQLLFRRNGLLHREFDNLYAALFKNSDDYVAVVKALSSKRSGLTRDEIVAATRLSSGGGLTTILSNLESCQFIRQYRNYSSGRGEHTVYQLIDFFTLFHFRFLDKAHDEGQWVSLQGQPKFYVWAGLTFELLVLSHVRQVKQKLGISGIQTSEYVWRSEDEHHGAQVDLIIDRADRTMNVCEIKFSMSAYEITKDYEMNLRNKLSQLMKLTGMKRSLILTMITAYGVQSNQHSGIVQQQILLDDLFSFTT